MAPTLRRVEDSAGFSIKAAGSDARRQLRMSLGVVVVLSLGIVSAAFTVGAHPLDARRSFVSSPSTALHAETDVAGVKPI